MTNRILTGNSPVVSYFVYKLGLENVTSLSLTIPSSKDGAALTVTMEVEPTEAGEAFELITKNYNLIEMPE